MAAAAESERRVEQFVRVGPKVPGGPWFVRLEAEGAERVVFGPYENPGSAQDDAKSLRQFLAAVLGDRR
jgi:hypothetical protein